MLGLLTHAAWELLMDSVWGSLTHPAWQLLTDSVSGSLTDPAWELLTDSVSGSLTGFSGRRRQFDLAKSDFLRWRYCDSPRLAWGALCNPLERLHSRSRGKLCRGPIARISSWHRCIHSPQRFLGSGMGSHRLTADRVIEVVGNEHAHGT